MSLFVQLGVDIMDIMFVYRQMIEFSKSAGSKKPKSKEGKH